MPFDSKAQQGWMHVHHPEIAKKWDKITDFDKLPYKKAHMAASDNAEYDDHASDPAKLSQPERFNKEVEKRMKQIKKAAKGLE